MEVMIVVMILGTLMTGLTQTVATVIQSMGFADAHSQTSGTAAFAMARMVRFVGDTYEIPRPTVDDGEDDRLEVVERTLDLVDRSDEFVDADTDADGLINDVKEYVTFTLDDTTDPDNWKLVETVPNYLSADNTSDSRHQVICEHVTEFVTERLNTSVVRIRLTTGKNEMSVTLETRARARLIFP